MSIRRALASLLTTILLAPIPSPANEDRSKTSLMEQVRYYEKDGVTYCETRRAVDQRVPETRLETRTETVYRTQTVTQNQEVLRVYWTPVTEYRCEAYWVNRWNPFAEPYLGYRYVPRTRWEQKSEMVKVPVTVCQMVPETRTVQVPVTSYRTVQRDVVSQAPITRNPNPSLTAARSAPVVARQQQVGGIRRLDNDPPRYGYCSGWRAAGTLR